MYVHGRKKIHLDGIRIVVSEVLIINVTLSDRFGGTYETYHIKPCLHGGSNPDPTRIPSIKSCLYTRLHYNLKLPRDCRLDIQNKD